MLEQVILLDFLVISVSNKLFYKMASKHAGHLPNRLSASLHYCSAVALQQCFSQQHAHWRTCCVASAQLMYLCVSFVAK
jgi:hypothetical protein